MGKSFWRWAAVAVAVAALTAVPVRAGATAQDRVDAYLDAVRDEPGRLREFMVELPKGGDLHTHLSGAVPTDKLIDFAVEDDLCIDTTTYVSSQGQCVAGQRPASDVRTDGHFYDRVMRAWSMKGFPGRTGTTGHDHFFDTFTKFSAATERKGDMLAVVGARTAAQNIGYLEPLFSRQSTAMKALAKQVGYDSDLATMHAKLRSSEAFGKIVKAAIRETDEDFARYRSVLRCDLPDADPGCGLAIRIDFQVGRIAAPEVVFANLLLGFVLADCDPRYVGVNLVQPEDAQGALDDYRLHMRMVRYLKGVYRKAHVTLHAGELAAGFGKVKPSDLTFHIRDAVETAGADRIGHGVDIASEDEYEELLGKMAQRHTMVEIALTSNCQILRVCAPKHPFALYRSSGVPVALATDDEGVSHTDLTHEFVRAARDFRLRYTDLKTMARASLEHSFLAGRSLWRAVDDHYAAKECAADVLGASSPRAACQELLKSSDKAKAQWRQEAAFQRFEQRYGEEDTSSAT